MTTDARAREQIEGKPFWMLRRIIREGGEMAAEARAELARRSPTCPTCAAENAAYAALLESQREQGLRYPPPRICSDAYDILIPLMEASRIYGSARRILKDGSEVVVTHVIRDTYAYEIHGHEVDHGRMLERLSLEAAS